MKKRELHNFFLDKKWLILDTTNVGKSSVRQMAIELGATVDKILIADDMDEAITKLQQEQPHFVFTTFAYEDRSGLELLSLHKEVHSNRLHTAFCVISDNNSLVHCMRMAEKEVDLVIIRPYTNQVLMDEFVNAVEHKLDPAPFLEALEAGKEKLYYDNGDGAISDFEKAKESNPDHPMAYAYLGGIYFAKKEYPKAKEYYQDGLSKDAKHYRSLRGLFDVYFEEGSFAKAYEISARIMESHTLNPKMLPSIIRVCVSQEKYDDIIGFCSFFSCLDENKEEDDLANIKIRKHLVAGLVVAGEYLFSKGKAEDAVDAIKQAAQFCLADKKVIRKMVVTLISNDHHHQAQEILEDLTQEERIDHRSRKLLELEIGDLIFPPEKVVHLGIEMINEGIKDFVVYDLVIAHSIAMERNTDSVKELIFDAIDLYPEKKDYFTELLPK